MKRLFVQGLVLLSLLMIAVPTWSLTIADVGSIDQLIGQAAFGNSGDATELTWIRNVLNNQTLMMSKYDVTASDWENISGLPSVFGLDLVGTPEYFFVKTGANTGNTNDFFLFRNLSSFDYAVIDLVEMGFTGGNVVNIGKISHIGEIPEPGTIMLLGVGLLGLAGYGRRRLK